MGLAAYEAIVGAPQNVDLALSAASFGSLVGSWVDGKIRHVLLIGAVGEALETALVVACGLLDLLQGCLRLQKRGDVAEAIVAVEATALADAAIFAISGAARVDTLVILMHILH